MEIPESSSLIAGAVRDFHGTFVCFEEFTGGDFLFSDWNCCASLRGSEFRVHCDGRMVHLRTCIRSISSGDDKLYFCSSSGTLFVLIKPTMEVKRLRSAPVSKVDCSGPTAYCIAGDNELFEIKTRDSEPIVLFPVPRSPAFKVKSIACGSEFLLCLTPTGQVFSKGLGSRGQLGLADLEDRSDFTLVSALQTLTVVAVSAGRWHSACVTDTGDLYTWGWNEFGQLGHRSCSLLKKSGVVDSDVANAVSTLSLPKPVDFPCETCVVQVSCGSRHTVCLTDDAEVFAFGWNGFGQLGLSKTTVAVDTPTLVFPLGSKVGSAKVQKVICGPWSTALLLSSPES